MKRSTALAIISMLALARTTAAISNDCTKPPNAAFFAVVEQERGQCQARIELALELPLTTEQREKFCSKCSKLAVATAKRQFGNCTVYDRRSGRLMTLQAQMEQIFVCSDDALTSSSSDGFDAVVIGGQQTPLLTPASPSVQPSRDRVDTNSTTDTSDRDSPIGTGAIVAIVLACAAVVGLVVALAIRRQRQRQRRHHQPTTANETEAHKRQHSLLLTATPSKQQQSGALTPVLDVAVALPIHNVDDRINNRSQQQSVPAAASAIIESDDCDWDDDVIIAARVPREKVLAETLLSRGGFGEVYRGTYNGRVVAIKTLLPDAKKSMKQITAFLSEIKLMATLEHARIVTFVGVAWDSLTDLCVLSEFMAGGDLRGLLTQFDNDSQSHGFTADKVKIALHVADALTYLHSLQPAVLHRDLKSKNILLDSQLNAKLTDFGVSRANSYRTMTACVGTSLWMAPEVTLGERYDEKADVFSFGVVLSELDSHALPYVHAAQRVRDHRLPDTAILQLVSLGRLSVQFSHHANPAVVALARACVSVDPTQRPTAAAVRSALHRVLERMASPPCIPAAEEASRAAALL